MYGDSTLRDRRGRKPVSGGGGVRLDGIITADISLRWDAKDTVVGTIDLNAECGHCDQSHVDVGFGNEVAHDVDLDWSLRQRRRHQQAAEVLAADIGID